MSEVVESLRARLDEEMRQVDDPQVRAAWPGQDSERIIASIAYKRLVLASHRQCDMSCIDIRAIANTIASRERERRMSDDSFRDRWAEDYDGDHFTGRYECRRCGASVRPQNTDLHDEFHAKIDALADQRGGPGISQDL